MPVMCGLDVAAGRRDGDYAWVARDAVRMFSVGFRPVPERMETAMNLQTWTGRWWEASVVVLAAFMAVTTIFVIDGNPGWALILGSAAVLLSAGLVLRSVWRMGATAMVIAGSLLAAIPFWGILNVILAFVIIIGGFRFGKIGPDPAKVTEEAT